MKSKKIAIAINSSWNIYNFRSGLVRAMVQAGHDVVAIAPYDTYSDRLTELGCRFVPVKMSARGTSPIEDAKLLLQYRRILKEHRPSVFLGYTIKPNVYGSLAAQSLGIPVINNIAGLGVSFLKQGLFQMFVRNLYRAALHRSKTIFFQNPDDARLFIDAEVVKEQQSQLLPGSGVDLDRFAPVRRIRQAQDPFVFLIVSRLLRSKGIADYAAAAEAIRAEGANAEFRLAGILEQGHPEAIDEGEVRRWVANGAINYLGPLNDVRPALAGADAVVLPTFYPEGTPRALLEAAAMAKPLLATDVPGCREVVRDGVNGFLFPPKSLGELIAAMRKMLDMSEEGLAAMGAASRARAESKFDERIVISRYLEAIEKAVSSEA